MDKTQHGGIFNLPRIGGFRRIRRRFKLCYENLHKKDRNILDNSIIKGIVCINVLFSLKLLSCLRLSNVYAFFVDKTAIGHVVKHHVF